MDRTFPNNVADAQAEIRRLEALVRQRRREIAQATRMVELLQGLTPETAQWLGRPRLDSMLQAEGELAASEESQCWTANGPDGEPAASS